VATYRAEYWMLNKDTTEQQVLRKMCGVIKVNENWRK